MCMVGSSFSSPKALNPWQMEMLSLCSAALKKLELLIWENEATFKGMSYFSFSFLRLGQLATLAGRLIHAPFCNSYESDGFYVRHLTFAASVRIQ